MYTTITSLCPVTETKTVGGKTVYVTYYSTSTIVKEVPTTVPVYVTSITTVYKTTDVYTTTTCPVTTYVSREALEIKRDPVMLTFAFRPPSFTGARFM